MAELLKNQFGPGIPKQIAAMIKSVSPRFNDGDFIHDTLDGYEQLELVQRGWQIAKMLRRYLPEKYETAIQILIESQGPKLVGTEGHGMAPFLYMPHIFFVAEYGIDNFEISMDAQYELTQRFTAEFSVRRFIERYPKKSLKCLKNWTEDPSVHVRRLVSEGTRPRLPWAPRLRLFQENPTPVIDLLELLKDDPELYVRRSVANNLNDIGKDHPSLLIETAREWMVDATENRRWLIEHALRSLIKLGDLGALSILGYSEKTKVSVANIEISPQKAIIGGNVRIGFDLINKDSSISRILVDFRVHYVKAKGNTSPKVFKLKSVELGPRESIRITKKLSLSQMTTRTHFPGIHQVDLLLNGKIIPLDTFELI